MPSFNKVILAGHLTRDPEIAYTPTNMAVCNFGLAVNNSWKGKDGTEREDVLFIDCAAFGRTAETLHKFFSKGKPILIEGKLKLDQWKDQSGGNRSKHKVTVDNFTFLEKRGESSDTRFQPPPSTIPREAHSEEPPF